MPATGYRIATIFSTYIIIITRYSRSLATYRGITGFGYTCRISDALYWVVVTSINGTTIIISTPILIVAINR